MLHPAEKLGPYEVIELIGKGGMGEVYRARDPRLNRDVAIKVSARQFSDRFARETKAIAKLNHPNICTLYDVGPNYLVMEFVEGENPKGPLPEEKVIEYARQIIAALDYAHENGVTHRDLKPGNIVVRPDGVLKVLDFGLAKIETTATEGDPAEAETVSMAVNGDGAIIGTPAYMAPEQARGQKVDKRADLWSLGVVLYELSTGERLFSASTMADVISQVVSLDPDLSSVSPKLRILLSRCLERDPRKRLRDAGDALVLLEVSSAVESTRTSRPWALAACAIIAAALAVPAVRHFNEHPVARDAVTFEVAPPEARISFSQVSPDGKYLAFRDSGKTYLRRMETGETRPLSVTANFLYWRPDSREIGLNVLTGIRRFDVQSGTSTAVTGIQQDSQSGTWNQFGDILFTPQISGDVAVRRVSMTGGDAQAVTRLDTARGETAHRFATFLPDGKHFLFYAFHSDQAASTVEIGSLGTFERKTVAGIHTPVVVAGNTGYVLFLTQASVSPMYAQRFDATSAKLVGEPVLIADSVAGIGVGLQLPDASASNTGVLSYNTRRREVGEPKQILTDRSGKLLKEIEGLNGGKFSPNGRQIAGTLRAI